MSVRPRPLLSFPPSTVSPSTRRPLMVNFPLPASTLSKVISLLPLVFIFSVLFFSFYAYFLSLTLYYILLTRHDTLKALVLGTTFLVLWSGCTSSVAVAYWRGGGDVPGAVHPTGRDLEAGGDEGMSQWERAIERESRIKPPTSRPRIEDGGAREEGAALLAEDEEEEEEDEEDEIPSPPPRRKPGKMVARDPQTRGERGRSGAMDMVAALRDLEGPSERKRSGPEREEGEWGRRKGGMVQVKGDGGARFCRKCQVEKPDRAHHCSSCGKCVLKMDHHCPWLAGCVGYYNYKAFILFLCYGGLLGAFVGASTIHELMKFVDDAPENYELAPISWALVMLLGLIFGFCMGLFGLYHVYLVCRNRTTLEAMEGSSSYAVLPTSGSSSQSFKPTYALTRNERRKLEHASSKYNAYDVGVKRNLYQVFGGWDQACYWLTPFGWSPGDGTVFPVDKEKLRKLREITTEVRMQGEAGSPESASSLD